MENKGFIESLVAIEDHIKQQEQKLCVNVKEAAKLCGCSEGLMRKMVHAKGFPKVVIGRRILIPYKAFVEWINEGFCKEDNNYWA